MGLLAAFAILSVAALAILSKRAYFSAAASSAVFGLGASAAADPRPSLATVAFSLSEQNRSRSSTWYLYSALIF